MAKYIVILLLLFLIGSSLWVSRNFMTHEKTVADIANYQMTTSDLHKEWKNAEYIKKDANLEKLLDVVKRRYIFILEAERRGLHKKEAFREKVEQFWKDELIRALHKDIVDEVWMKATTEQEAQKLYKEKLDELIAHYYASFDEQAAKEIFNDIHNKKESY